MLASVRPRPRQSAQSGLSFANAVTYDTGGFDARAVVAADVNGDGKLDLVIVNECGGNDPTCASTSGTVSVLLNNGNGTFGTAVTYGPNGYFAVAAAVGDVNGDGKPDIVVANNCAAAPGSGGCTTYGNVAVLLGNGDGTFQPTVTYDSGGSYAQSVAIADVNGDGKPDLVVVNQCGGSACSSPDGSVAVLLGNGDGTFQTAVTYDTGAFASVAVAVADVNSESQARSASSQQLSSGHVHRRQRHGSSASLTYPVLSPPNIRRLALWLPLFGLPGLAMVGIWSGCCRRRYVRAFYVVALLCLLFTGLALTACGGSSGSSNKGGTPGGTYNLLVTGSFTSGSSRLSHTQQLTLVVQ